MKTFTTEELLAMPETFTTEELLAMPEKPAIPDQPFGDPAEAPNILNKGFRVAGNWMFQPPSKEGGYGDAVREGVAQASMGIASGVESADALLNSRPELQESANARNRLSEARAAQSNQDFGPRTAQGVIRSAIPSLAGAAVGGPVGAVAGAVGIQGSQAATKGTDAGLDGADLKKYVANQMVAEGLPALLFQAAGLGGAEKLAGNLFKSKAVQETAVRGIRSALKALGVSTAEELPEEYITTAWQMASDKAQLGQNPSSEDVWKAIVDVAAQTTATVGLFGSPNVALGAAQSISDARNGGSPSPVAPPPPETPSVPLPPGMDQGPPMPPGPPPSPPNAPDDTPIAPVARATTPEEIEAEKAAMRQRMTEAGMVTAPPVAVSPPVPPAPVPENPSAAAPSEANAPLVESAPPETAPAAPGAAEPWEFGDVYEDALKARHSRLRKEFLRNKGLSHTGENGTRYILTGSSKPGEKFQLTGLANGVPHYDNTFSDLDEAIAQFDIDAGLSRADLPDDLAFAEAGDYEFIYEAKQRPVAPGAVPKDGFVRQENGGEYGKAVYDRPLSEKELSHFDLAPVGYERVVPLADEATPEPSGSPNAKSDRQPDLSITDATQAAPETAPVEDEGDASFNPEDYAPSAPKTPSLQERLKTKVQEIVEKSKAVLSGERAYDDYDNMTWKQLVEQARARGAWDGLLSTKKGKAPSAHAHMGKSDLANMMKAADPQGTYDYDSMTRKQLVRQLEEAYPSKRENSRLGRQDVIDALRDMNKNGVGAWVKVDQETEGIVQAKDAMNSSPIAMPGKYRGVSSETWEDFGGRQGLPPRWFSKNARSTWDQRLQELSSEFPDVFRPDMGASEFFDVLRRPESSTILEYTETLDDWLQGRNDPAALAPKQPTPEVAPVEQYEEDDDVFATPARAREAAVSYGGEAEASTPRASIGEGLSAEAHHDLAVLIARGIPQAQLQERSPEWLAGQARAEEADMRVHPRAIDPLFPSLVANIEAKLQSGESVKDVDLARGPAERLDTHYTEDGLAYAEGRRVREDAAEYDLFGEPIPKKKETPKPGVQGDMWGEDRRIVQEDDPRQVLLGGTEARITTKEGYAAAKAKLKKDFGRYGNLRITPDLGIEADILKDLAYMGLYHFENGIRSFAEFSKAMIEDYGDIGKKKWLQVWRAMEPGRKEILSMEKRMRGKKTPASKVKKQLNEALVTHYKGEPVTMNANALMRLAMAQQAKGAGYGYRQGRKEGRVEGKAEGKAAGIKEGKRIGNVEGQLSLQSTHKQLAEFARKHLPEDQYKMVAAVLQRVAGSRTNADIKKIIIAVNRLAEQHARKTVVKDFKAAIKEAKKENLRPAERKALDDLIGQFNVSEPSDKVLDRMQAVLDAHAKDDIGQIPQALVDKAKRVLEDAQKMPLGMISVDGLRTITSLIRNIVHQSNRKNEMIFGKKMRDAKKVISDAVKQVVGRRGEKYKGRNPLKVKSQGLLRRLSTWDQLPLHAKAAMCDGGKGAVSQLLYDNFRRAHSYYCEIQERGKAAALEGLEKAGVSAEELTSWSKGLAASTEGTRKAIRRFYRGVKEGDYLRGESPEPIAVERVVVNIGGKPVTMTVAERIDLLCHMLDGDTRAEMLRDSGGGIVFKSDLEENAYKLKADDLRAIRDSASAKEHAVAKAMRDFVNGSLKDDLNKAWLDLFGYERTMDDDYWMRTRSKEFEGVEPNQIMRDFANRDLKRQSTLKERSKSTDPILVEDVFTKFYAHVNQVAAFVAKEGAVYDAERLLDNPDFKTAMLHGFKYGQDVISDMRKTVSDFRGLDYQDPETQERIVAYFKRKAHVGAMGAKPHIVVAQPISVINAIAYIDLKYIVKGIRASKEDTRDEIKKWSASLHARATGTGHQILTPGVETPVVADFYGLESAGRIERVSMGGIKKADFKVAEWLWEASKREGQDKGLSGDALMEYTRDRAEELMDLTQPTWDPHTISSLHRAGKSHPIASLGIMFSSERNKNHSLVVRAVDAWMHGEITKKELGVKVLMPTLVNSVLYTGAKKGWFTVVGGVLMATGLRDDEEEENTELLTKALGAVLENISGIWLVSGDALATAARMVVHGWTKKPSYGVGADSNILVDAMENVYVALAEGGLAASQLVDGDVYKSGEREGETKWEASALRALDRAMRASGMLLGLPYSGLSQLFGGL